jgi:hypothetical protein
MAAPAKDGDSFVLDMATSSVALGKVHITWVNIVKYCYANVLYRNAYSYADYLAILQNIVIAVKSFIVFLNLP